MNVRNMRLNEECFINIYKTTLQKPCESLVLKEDIHLDVL